MPSATKSVKFFRMALSATFFAYAAVLFGSYVRYSDAGLGCPDWPGCYGKLFAPMTAQDYQRARQLENEIKTAAPTADLGGHRAWHEVVQRYLGGALGLILIRMAWLGWQLKKRRRRQQWIIPLVTMLTVFGTVTLGALAFDLRLKPLVMMIQILGGFTVLALLWWIVMREQRFWKSLSTSAITRAVRPWTLIGIAIAGCQITLGAWSMVNYAGLACPDFPMCQGVYWPNMDILQGLAPWRAAGLEYDSASLSLPAETAIHMAHRLGALIALLYIGWLSLHVLRVGIEGNLCRYGLLVLIMLLSTTALGVMTVVTHLPLAVAVAHSGVAVLLLLSLVTLYHVVRPARA